MATKRIKETKKKIQDQLKAGSLTKKLMIKLQQHPDLIIKLNQALEAKGFLLTLSWYEVDPREPARDLQHFWKQHEYKSDDVPGTFRYLLSDWIGKCRPDMEPTDTQGFV